MNEQTENHHDFTDDPDYQSFVAKMAEECRCLPIDGRPCDGLLAGGLCDNMDMVMDDDGPCDDHDCGFFIYGEDW